MCPSGGRKQCLGSLRLSTFMSAGATYDAVTLRALQHSHAAHDQRSGGLGSSFNPCPKKAWSEDRLIKLEGAHAGPRRVVAGRRARNIDPSKPPALADPPPVSRVPTGPANHALSVLYSAERQPFRRGEGNLVLPGRGDNAALSGEERMSRASGCPRSRAPVESTTGSPKEQRTSRFL
jgi:hypothetical protein